MNRNNLISPKKLSFCRQPFLMLLAVYSTLILFYGIWGALRESNDQRSFFETSKLLMSGQNPYLSSIKYIQENMPNISLQGLDFAGGRSMYPPSAHIMFIPFYAFLFSPQAAKISWLFWNLLFLIIIYYVFSKRYLAQLPKKYAYIFICLLIGASSTKTNLSLGQTALFSFAAFLLSLAFSNSFLRGLSFTFAISKPSLMVLFCFYYLFRKQYKTIMIALFIHIFTTWIIAIWLRTSPFQLFKDYALKVFLLVSYESAVSFLFQTNGVSLKTIFYLLHLSSNTITMLTVFLYCLAIVSIYIHRYVSEIQLFGLISILTVLIDYHQHYDFTILLFVFPVIAIQLKDKITFRWFLYYYLFLMYLPNLSRLNLILLETSYLFMNHHYGLLCWQFFYTSLFIILLWTYAKHFLKTAIPSSQASKRN